MKKIVPLLLVIFMILSSVNLWAGCGRGNIGRTGYPQLQTFCRPHNIPQCIYHGNCSQAILESWWQSETNYYNCYVSYIERLRSDACMINQAYDNAGDSYKEHKTRVFKALESGGYR